MYAAQIFKVTYISAHLDYLSSLDLDLATAPFKTTYYKAACLAWFSHQAKVFGLWYLLRKRTTFQCWFAGFPGWKNLILCAKWKENEKPTIPPNNNKWQEVRCARMCVFMCDRLEFAMWAFEDLKAVVYSRHAQCEKHRKGRGKTDIRGGLCGWEQSFSMPTSIPLATDQDNSFPKHCTAWPLSSPGRETLSVALKG